MNTKKNFGTFLSVIGMIALMFTALIMISSTGGQYDYKNLMYYGIPGFLLFFSGMGVTSSSKGEA